MQVSQEPVAPRVANWLAMIQADYREMPGTSLTRRQMQRLWGFGPDVCDAVIDALVAAQVLREARDGQYVAFGSSR